MTKTIRKQKINFGNPQKSNFEKLQKPNFEKPQKSRLEKILRKSGPWVVGTLFLTALAVHFELYQLPKEIKRKLLVVERMETSYRVKEYANYVCPSNKLELFDISHYKKGTEVGYLAACKLASNEKIEVFCPTKQPFCYHNTQRQLESSIKVP